MNRNIAIAITLGLMMVGCGAKPRPNAPAKPAAEASGDLTPEPKESAGKITARLFRRDVADGEIIGPSLEVFSPNASQTENGIMNFGDARVTIFGEDGQRTVMTAKNGTLDQNNDTAELSGGVVIKMGTQTIRTEHVSWNNEKREAIAESGVKITDGDTELTAEVMRFSPDQNTLTLEQVTGIIRLPKTGPSAQASRKRRTWRTFAMWLVMATPVYAQAGGDTVYTHVVLDKPAPKVIFRDNRLEQMTGGVEIQLKTADENDAPLILNADTIDFGWNEGATTELASLDMTGNVRVSSSEGQIRAANAKFDVTEMTIAFAGDVRGRFEGIDEFQADWLKNHIESGDMELHNLRATIPFGDNQGGDAGGFSQMKVKRAANVRIAQGQIQYMRGGVEVTLTPQDTGAKPIALRADTFGFTYADDSERQPESVVMEGAVRVDAPQGLIQSDKADFGVSSGLIKFRGNVHGQSDMLKSFRATSFDYDLDTEDGLLRSFQARGVQIGSPNAKDAYRTMDVRRAPKVRMRGGRVTNMSGGVKIRLDGDSDRGPLTAEAQTIDIAYDGPNATAPSAVNMKGEVSVISSDTVIHADTADLNMQTETVDFAGNIVADSPSLKGVTGTRLRYDLKTGNIVLYGRVEEVLQAESKESPEQP